MKNQKNKLKNQKKDKKITKKRMATIVPLEDPIDIFQSNEQENINETNYLSGSPEDESERKKENSENKQDTDDPRDSSETNSEVI